jgi:hypothetical protein
MRHVVPPYMLDVATYPFYGLMNDAYSNLKESGIQFDGAAYSSIFLSGKKDIIPSTMRRDRYAGFVCDTMGVHKKSVRFVFPPAYTSLFGDAISGGVEALNANQLGFEMTMRYLYVGDRFVMHFSEHAINAFGLDTIYVATLNLGRVKAYFENGLLNDELFQTVIESKGVFANVGAMKKKQDSNPYGGVNGRFEKWLAFETLVSWLNELYEEYVSSSASSSHDEKEGVIEYLFEEVRTRMYARAEPYDTVSSITSDWFTKERLEHLKKRVFDAFSIAESFSSSESDHRYDADREWRRMVDTMPDIWHFFILYKTFHEIKAYEPTGFTFSVGLSSESGSHFVSESFYPNWFSTRFSDLEKTHVDATGGAWEYYDDLQDSLSQNESFDTNFKRWTGMPRGQAETKGKPIALAYGSDPSPWLIGAMTNVACKRYDETSEEIREQHIRRRGASDTSETYNVLTIDATDDIHQLIHCGLMTKTTEGCKDDEVDEKKFEKNTSDWKDRVVDVLEHASFACSHSGDAMRRVPIIMRMGETYKDSDIRALQRYLIVSHRATLESAGTCLSSISYVLKK